MSIPVTKVRTSHALTIRANGEIIGLINSWTPAQSRTLTPIYEVGVDDSGNPIEYMPGNASGLTVNISRYDLYTKRMEEAFGTPDLIMLTRQSEPFDIFEEWTIPDPSLIFSSELQHNIAGIPFTNFPTPFIVKERYVYQKCWFTSLGRTLRSDDSRVVNVNATLVYTKKLKGQGIAGDLIKGASEFSLSRVLGKL